MGLFKSMKDMAEVTKQGKQMQDSSSGKPATSPAWAA